MREGWTETGLGDIAEVLDRLRKPISGAEREKRIGDVPYYGATGLAGWIDKPIFDEELVLLGEDAIDFLNPNVHKAYLISGPSWVNNHAHVLRAKKEKVLSFFLMEALNGVDYSQFVAFGTRSKLTQGAMMGISVRVPPLAEQKRIVDLMSSVDAYIDALQQQSDMARTARNAVLHELLSVGGDGWTETTLGDVVTINPEAVKGLSQDDEIVYVDLSSVSAESGISADLYRGAFGEAPGRARRVIRSQDVLVSTVRPYLKGFALVPANLDGEIASTGFAVLRADPKKILSGFIWATVGLNNFVDYLMDRATGSSYPAVRPDDVASFELSLPPLVEQKWIVDILSSMDELIQSTEQAVVDAKNLRSSLLSDLLSGEHEIPASYDSFLGAA
jgi:type I restriction enzyme S subunit